MYILTGDYEETEVGDFRPLKEAYNRYLSHIEQFEGCVSNKLYQFAMDQWRDDPNNDLLLHGSQLRGLSLNQKADGNRQSHDISVRLVNRTGNVETSLTYMDCQISNVFWEAGDARLNSIVRSEVRFANMGASVIHEIEWRSGNRWLIEFKDLEIVLIDLDT